MQKHGLKEQLKVAQSLQELDILFNERHEYRDASDKTQRSWKRIYIQKRNELLRKAS